MIRARENMGRVATTYTKDTKGAFTIIELLVVIAIIALLVALLLPALSRSRSMSTRVVCMSTLRQYSVAGLAYLDDNNNAFPEDPNEWLYSKKSISKEHPMGCRWHDQDMSPGGETMNYNVQYRGIMWDYFYKMGFRICPIFRDIAKKRDCENPNHNKEIEIIPQYSYTMNGYLGSKEAGGVTNESEVRKPSEVFFFAEENSWSVRPDHPKYPARWLQASLSTKALDDTVLCITPTPEAKDCFATYHGSRKDHNRGSGNVAFIDGHVEMVRVEEQLRKNIHGIESENNPAGNLSMGWASKTPPPGGWDAQ
ncbi:MAG: prepilin-type N-terminal cleavage/methylation domain-containing protein [Planctomycetota bacterium]